MSNIVRYLKDSKCPHGILFGQSKLKCSKCKEIYFKSKDEKRREKQRIEISKKIEIQNTILKKKFQEKIREWVKTNCNYYLTMDPFLFEKSVANIFEEKGYRAIVTSKVNDEGKDIILSKDSKKIYVECKRYSESNKVSRPVIQKLYAAMVVDNISEGIIITTSDFTEQAIEYVKRLDRKINLINGTNFLFLVNEVYRKSLIDDRYEQLCSNYEEKNGQKYFNCGEKIIVDINCNDKNICTKGHVNIPFHKTIYESIFLKDSNKILLCPLCGSKMVLRKSKIPFYGCTTYPRCKGKIQLNKQ